MSNPCFNLYRWWYWLPDTTCTRRHIQSCKGCSL